MRPAESWQESEVERLTEPVASVDPVAHRVVMESGQELEYQKALIATGGRNRRLDIPGVELAGVHQLRTVAECDAIKDEIEADRHAVVSGWGSSAARSWRP